MREGARESKHGHGPARAHVCLDSDDTGGAYGCGTFPLRPGKVRQACPIDAFGKAPDRIGDLAA